MGKSPALFLATAASLDAESRKGKDAKPSAHSADAGKSYYGCGNTVSQRTPAKSVRVPKPMLPVRDET